MSELFEYMQQIVFEVESGRLKAADVRRRMIQDWGGVRVRDYIPKRDTEQRLELRKWESEGIAKRTAQRKIYGK